MTTKEIIELSSLIDKYPKVASELLKVKCLIGSKRKTYKTKVTKNSDPTEEPRFKDGKYYYRLTCTNCGRERKAYFKNKKNAYQLQHWKCLKCRKKKSRWGEI